MGGKKGQRGRGKKRDEGAREREEEDFSATGNDVNSKR